MGSGFRVGGLKFNVGEFSDLLETAIRKAEADRLVERVWGRDHTLWKPEPVEISNRLGWLDVAQRMRTEIPAVLDFVKSVKADGIDRVLLLGMGGSSLAPELFSRLFGGIGSLPLSVLDSTDPDAVREKERTHNPKRTLYIVSSKSGGTIETTSFFKYFYNQALAELGAAKAGKHFIAITDSGSGLAKTADQFQFRHIFLADPNIGGRYSALSHFGLVPAALVGVDLDRLLPSAEGMAELCREPISRNPGAMLGLFLGSLAVQGRGKATFDLPDEKASFGDWVEQLIAESTGKEGKGILPVVREPRLSDGAYGNDRVFISTRKVTAAPLVELEWSGGYEIGGQFFLWEFATAVAGCVMGINPFDQPNVESAKVQARAVVNDYLTTGELPKGETRTFAWPELKRFTTLAKQGDYFALQVYASPNSGLSNALQQLRLKLSDFSALPTTVGYGPRFLHSTGQLHKGDGGNGLFIQLITPPPEDDVPIPDQAGQTASDITFGVLKAAQALGDAQALREARRRVITFEIKGDPTDAINAFLSEAVS